MPAISPFELDRTCPHPTHVGERTLPFTTENFYVRPSGSADYWCRECVRRYNREQRAARRTQGGSSRGRRFGVEIECMVDLAAAHGTVDVDGLRDYTTPVPTFATGLEAARHGLANVMAPGDDARRAIAKLERQRARLLGG